MISLRPLAVTLVLGLLVGCAGPDKAAPQATAAAAAPALLQGTLVPRDATAWPPGGMVVVEVREGADGQGAVVAEQRWPVPTGVAPLPFTLQFARAGAPTAGRHALRASVVAAGQASWTTDALAVDLRAARIDAGALALHLRSSQPLASRLQCGARLVSAQASASGLELTVDGDRAALAPVAVAAGARFIAAGLPETSFWSRGDSAAV
ncbi:MAG: YbaY family lipoprotein, partial [Rubrivivax sp.]|nr:YbaY family lipoprotein [Rubrivivax sp.]